jgi:hypothetical protein
MDRAFGSHGDRSGLWTFRRIIDRSLFELGFFPSDLCLEKKQTPCRVPQIFSPRSSNGWRRLETAGDGWSGVALAEESGLSEGDPHAHAL